MVGLDSLTAILTDLGTKLRKKPTAVRLTQSEYDALTSAEKHDTTKTYFITDGQGGGYTLPIASASTLGGIKVGSGLSINNSGVLSAGGTSDFVLLDERKIDLTSSDTALGTGEFLYQIQLEGTNYKEFFAVAIYYAVESNYDINHVFNSTLNSNHGIAHAHAFAIDPYDYYNPLFYVGQSNSCFEPYQISGSGNTSTVRTYIRYNLKISYYHTDSYYQLNVRGFGNEIQVSDSTIVKGNPNTWYVRVFAR